MTTPERQKVIDAYVALRERIAADVVKHATNAAHFLPGLQSSDVLDVIHAAVAVGRAEALADAVAKLTSTHGKDHVCTVILRDFAKEDGAK